MVRIKYYPADGCSYDCERDHKLLDGAVYASLYAARSAIINAIGDHGFFRDPDDGSECWHESKENGCGGYAIFEE